MYVKQCDCLKPCLWTTTFVDDRTSLILYTFFKTKCNFKSLKKYFIDKYIYFKILSLIQKCRHTQVMLQTVTLFYIHCAQSIEGCQIRVTIIICIV
jgi:hypothetical protein